MRDIDWPDEHERLSSGPVSTTERPPAGSGSLPAHRWETAWRTAVLTLLVLQLVGPGWALLWPRDRVALELSTGPTQVTMGVEGWGLRPGAHVVVTCHDSIVPQGFHRSSLEVDAWGRLDAPSFSWTTDGPEQWLVVAVDGDVVAVLRHDWPGRALLASLSASDVDAGRLGRMISTISPRGRAARAP